MVAEAGLLRSVALDLAQLCFDIAGMIEPTPVSDGASLLISLGRGRWFDAAVSGVSMIPYVGDLAKLGKLPRYLKSVEDAIKLARQSKEAAKLLAPVMAKLDRVLGMFPENAPGEISRIRNLVTQFLNENRVARSVAHALPDISHHFRFEEYVQGGHKIVEGSGKLGVPGKVLQHRSPSAQRALSGGTGDHAGHLIGNQFGAPGGGKNLGLLNANINTYAPKAQQHWAGQGGSYLQLEKTWEQKLKNGYGVEVRVRDRYRLGEDRPIARHVEWTEIHPNGGRSKHSLDFLNTTSPQSRAAQGLE
jgi:hypothetical protein